MRGLYSQSHHRFEKELEALRKELAEATSRSERSSPTFGPQSDDDLSTIAASPALSSKNLSPSISHIDLPVDIISNQAAVVEMDETRKDR